MENSESVKAHPVWFGFRLGMILQFGGMGPICFLLFQLAALMPFKRVVPGVIGVTLADAVYILISILGIIGIIKQVKNTFSILKKVNGLIIVYLGISFALMSLSERTSYLDFYNWDGGSVFYGVFILTILNPTTIICYTGVFNAKIMDLHMTDRTLYWFGLGTLLSTPFFMTIVVIIGSMGGSFLPDIAVSIMNLLVGAILVYWGLKYIFPKLSSKAEVAKN